MEPSIHPSAVLADQQTILHPPKIAPLNLALPNTTVWVIKELRENDGSAQYDVVTCSVL